MFVEAVGGLPHFDRLGSAANKPHPHDLQLSYLSRPDRDLHLLYQLSPLEDPKADATGILRSSPDKEYSGFVRACCSNFLGSRRTAQEDKVETSP